MANTTWVTKGVPLKIALLQNHLLQREAAEKLGLLLSTFNMKLRSERRFTPSEKEQLSILLGTPIHVLFPEDTSCSEHCPTCKGSARPLVVDH